MPKGWSSSRAALIIVFVISIVVTLVGGYWSINTGYPTGWKLYIQLPGSILVLFIVWFTQPIGIFLNLSSDFMLPLICILTMLINTSFYYGLVRAVLYIRRKLKSESDSNAKLA